MPQPSITEISLEITFIKYTWWNFSTLTKLMAFYWTPSSHYQNQSWIILNHTMRNKIQWNFHENELPIIQENAFSNVVCLMSAILFRPLYIYICTYVRMYVHTYMHIYIHIYSKDVMYQCALSQACIATVAFSTISQLPLKNLAPPPTPQYKKAIRCIVADWFHTQPREWHPKHHKHSWRQKNYTQCVINIHGDIFQCMNEWRWNFQQMCSVL